MDGYFDTTTGPKKVADSYKKIASEISENVEAIHFLSDSQAEVDAALEAALQATLVTRDSSEGLENFNELP